MSASFTPAFHASPSVANHLPPACQDSAASSAGSLLGMEARRTFLSSFLTFSATVLNSSQVLGTSMPYFSKRSVR